MDEGQASEGLGTLIFFQAFSDSIYKHIIL